MAPTGGSSFQSASGGILTAGGAEIMRGIEYVVDESGKRKAVLIDLELHEDLWEDFADQLIAREREQEPRESLAEVRRSLQTPIE
jgi:hypothetical protein